ncbi:MAG: hypothetical protein O6951_07320 [Actinobacteria bacterium]|nr:hypothetical protein [Actinomycetota bacterium]
MIETAAAPKPRRYSIAQLALLVPWVALVIDAFAPIRDNSFLWHIRAGELQAEAGEVLTRDPFSFTMEGAPWLTQSWLAELLYAWGEDRSGLGFVPWTMLMMSSVLFVGLGLVAYRRSKSVPATSVVLLLSTALIVSFLVPRPVIFSFALFVLVILAWERPSTRWTLPMLFWIWASVHGSFAIGLLYLGLSILSRREWRAWPTAAVSGLVTLATAHGLGIVQMLLNFVDSREALALLSEWARPKPWSIVFTPFLIGLGIVIIGAYRRTVEPRDLWIIAPFLALALTATRAVPPAWLALVPLVAVSMAGLKLGDRKRFGIVAAAIFAAITAVTPFVIRGDGTLDEERFPVASLNAMDDVPTFHDDRAGGYLIWASGPERLVYLDDRAELYGDRMAEFIGIREDEIDWQPVFQRDGIEQVLLRTEETLVERLEEAGWVSTHDDGFYVVMRP